MPSRYAEFDLERISTGARVVAFLAHADDECYIMAGTLARLAEERSAEVTLVCLSEKRRQELGASARVLGSRDVRVVAGLPSAATIEPAVLNRVVAEALDPPGRSEGTEHPGDQWRQQRAGKLPPACRRLDRVCHSCGRLHQRVR